MNSKSSSFSFLKFMFLIFNGIWILCGLVLVLIGTLLKTNFKLLIGDGMEMVLKRVPNSTVFIFIAVGAVIVLVSVFGNCGSASTDYRLLYAFCVINVLLLLVQLITIGLALKFSGQLEESADKLITRAIKEYEWSDNSTAIDNLQYNLRCCGAHGFNDWKLNEHFNIEDPVFPYSCCHFSKKGLSVCTALKVSLTNGCLNVINRKYRYRVLSLIAVSVVICVVQIILIMLALKLIKQLHNYETI